MQNVKPLSDDHVKALRTIFDRYNTYLGAFGPNEAYLQKKVETELGSKMIYLKMRCSGMGSEWGKVLRNLCTVSEPFLFAILLLDGVRHIPAYICEIKHK